jgi:hypothetical protein
VDDIALTLVSVPNPVTSGDHFNRALLGTFSQAPKKRHWHWIIVHLNGRKVGGVFGSNSFASSDPAEPQIYLEEVWELDEHERFIKKIDQSEGMLLFAKDIVAVEFFRYHEGGEATCQTKTVREGPSPTQQGRMMAGNQGT